jgi:phosphodiesterase/alkaline phosphatase D-like protein
LHAAECTSPRLCGQRDFTDRTSALNAAEAKASRETHRALTEFAPFLRVLRVPVALASSGGTPHLSREIDLMRINFSSFLATLAVASLSYAGDPVGEALPRVSVGDAIGGNAAVLVRPAAGVGNLTVDIARDAAFTEILSTYSLKVGNPLVPGKILLSGLEPGVRHHVRVTDGALVRTATFVTGAMPIGTNAKAPGVRFGVTGDWRGDVGIYNAILNADERELDYFVKLGDTIYADVASPAVPVAQATTLDEYRAKHIENYAPTHGIDPWGELAASTATFSMIDDHEVTNDFDGGAYDPATGWYNQGELYTNGLQAFVEHNAMFPTTWPALGDPRVDGRPNLYRSWQWGQHAATFMVDARSFRDQSLPPVANPFDPVQVGAFIQASFNPTRTMLGLPQLGLLLQDLQRAEAAGVTWKFVMTSMPMQNFGPLAGEDRWEGYAAERAYLLSQIVALGIRNVVFVTADFHGTIVNDITVPNPANPTQQLFTGMFEIVTGSVAYSAPAGPTFAQLGLSTGALTPAQYAFYQSLPNFAKDAFVQQLLDGVISGYGYSPTGIQDPSISANFTVGGPVAAHHYGWTEFDVDAQSKALKITTYGVDWYTPAEAAADPAGIIARPITVRQQIVLDPMGGFCAADLNADGTVNGGDLAILFGAWGPCAGCAADIDGNGEVEGDDLATVLSSWGDC